MTAILALLAKLPMWLYILVFAVCVISVQQWRVHHYRAQAAALQGVANTLHDANQTNLATIDALKATVDDWKHKCAANELEARQQAQASVAADRKSNARLDANIKTLHKEAAHDVSVKAWYEQPLPAAAVRVLAQGGSTD